MFSTLLIYYAGNMWAQSWMNIEPLVRPYPNKTSIDVTDEMQRQVGYHYFEISLISVVYYRFECSY